MSDLEETQIRPHAEALAIARAIVALGGRAAVDVIAGQCGLHRSVVLRRMMTLSRAAQPSASHPNWFIAHREHSPTQWGLTPAGIEAARAPQTKQPAARKRVAGRGWQG